MLLLRYSYQIKTAEQEGFDTKTLTFEMKVELSLII